MGGSKACSVRTLPYYCIIRPELGRRFLCEGWVGICLSVCLYDCARNECGCGCGCGCIVGIVESWTLEGEGKGKGKGRMSMWKAKAKAKAKIELVQGLQTGR